MKTHAAHLEEFKSQTELDNVKYYQELYLLGNAKQRKIQKTENLPERTIDNFEYLPLETTFNAEKN